MEIGKSLKRNNRRERMWLRAETASLPSLLLAVPGLLHSWFETGTLRGARPVFFGALSFDKI